MDLARRNGPALGKSHMAAYLAFHVVRVVSDMFDHFKLIMQTTTTCKIGQGPSYPGKVKWIYAFEYRSNTNCIVTVYKRVLAKGVETFPNPQAQTNPCVD